MESVCKMKRRCKKIHAVRFGIEYNIYVLKAENITRKPNSLLVFSKTTHYLLMINAKAHVIVAYIF